MKITDLLKDDVVLVMTSNDLREFAILLIEEAKKLPKDDDDTLYPIHEFAKKHKVDVDTVIAWHKAKIITPIKIGNKTFYRDSDFKKI